MTLGEWLDARVPQPPPALRDKLDSELGENLATDVRGAADVLLAAGRRLLADVVAARPQQRSHALDLLAADALVTYAFEAASELDQPVGAVAARAMRELSTLPEAH